MRLWCVAGLALAASACSPGVGRDPVFPDATVRVEAGVPDVGFVDAGFRDAGPQDVPVFLPDAGPPARYPFTGVFGILGDPSLLYAREVQGRLHVVVGGFPYSYVGTISEAGQVDLRSPELEASNCTIPVLRGTYSRPDALHDLLHQTCNAQGQAISSQLRGGFIQDYDAQVSGEYEVQTRVTTDIMNCMGLGPIPETGHWGVNLLSDGTIAVFVAWDPVRANMVYFGRAQGDLSAFTALNYATADTGGTQYAMQARFEQLTALDPVRILGSRDVYLPQEGCTVSVAFEATRVAGP